MTAVGNWTGSLDRLTLAWGPSQLHRGRDVSQVLMTHLDSGLARPTRDPLSQLRASETSEFVHLTPHGTQSHTTPDPLTQTQQEKFNSTIWNLFGLGPRQHSLLRT